MNKVKRILAVFLALLLTLSMMAGCGGTKQLDGTTASSQDAGTTKDAAVTESVKLDPVKLSIYFLTWSGQQRDQALVEEEMAKYLKDKINCTVEMFPLDWDTFITKTNAMSAANEPYDICFTAGWCEFYTGAAKNRWLDLNKDGLLDKYGAKIKERLGEVFLKGGQYFDPETQTYRQYALPVYKEKAHAQGLVFNKALVDKYNIDINSIKTNEDLLPIFKLIKENEPDIVVFSTTMSEPASWGNNWVEFERISGDTVPGELYADRDDDKVVNRFETPEYREWVDFARKCFLAGYIPAEAASKTNTLNQKFNDGLVFCAPFGLKPGKDAEMSTEKVTWVQKYMSDIYSAQTDMNGSMSAISRTSRNPERAMMFLNLLYTDKTFINLLKYGIENRHYYKVSENVIHTIPDSGYEIGLNWMFGDQTLDFLTDMEDPLKWQKFEEFNQQAKPYKSLGFQFNVEPWSAQYAAVKTVMQQYSEPLNVGAVDPNEYLPKFLQKLKDAGVDEYLAALQKEFSEWYAQNKRQ